MGPNSSVIAFTRFLARAVGDTESQLTLVLAQGAQRIAAEARRRCPVETDRPFRRRPGLLRDSIGWTMGPAPVGATFKAVATGGKLSATVFAGNGEAYYARFVEFGTAAGRKGARTAIRFDKAGRGRIGRKVYRNHPGTKPRPFFWPAYQMHKNQIYSDIRAAMKRALEAA